MMFAGLRGNTKTKEMLERLVSSRRVPNSLLFTGEDGLGKRLFALEIAKSFVCQNLTEAGPCNSCSACKRAESFVFPTEEDKRKDEFKRIVFSEHPDIGMVIPFRRNVLVDAIRDLEKEANFRPYEAKARVFIVNDADKMNLEASNALLKTLEEPSPTSFIFLITSRPMALLPTIRSRCQKINFAPLDVKEIESYLLETKKYSPEDAALLARISRGSIGKAVSLDLEKFLKNRDVVLNALRSLAPPINTAQVLRTAEEINNEKNKPDYESFLEILQTLIHDTWLIKQGAESQQLVNLDIRELLEDIAVRADSKKLALWLEDIETLRENLIVNLNRKIATDAFFVRMAKG